MENRAEARRIPMHAPGAVLTDAVVRLAPFELPDAHTVMLWDADPEVQRWFDWPSTPKAGASASHAARLASAEDVVRSKWKLWETGQEFAFVIHSAEGGEGLGWVDLQPRGGGRANVAYGVLPSERGKGTATRSVVLASRFGFDTLQMSRLQIVTNADNTASRRVAVKAGFQLEGVLRSYGVVENYEPMRGQRFDQAIYGRLRSDPFDA